MKMRDSNVLLYEPAFPEPGSKCITPQGIGTIVQVVTASNLLVAYETWFDGHSGECHISRMSAKEKTLYLELLCKTRNSMWFCDIKDLKIITKKEVTRGTTE